ncbi:integral membrane sensor signal transduction histidine kinase [Rhizobium sp. CF080]|uniref:HAMP domain-containing sensor histidine kinase n=1 Tax=Rhizobium sp. (strain CF080) TaxID=1144310 RepID=UPI000271ACEE|nr:ATP-binding protein [Rhizobium sp. CF080]EUB99957.1 integral membrane sensor signal transduction histidine kinase [Rhizobium sp. CF080]
MRRLFWKFFLVVWLALTSTLVAVMSLNVLFDFLPPKKDRYEVVAQSSLDLAAQTLSTMGIDLATQYTEAIRKGENPVALTITRLPESDICVREAAERYMRTAAYRGACYRVSASPFQGSVLSDYFVQGLPWFAAVVSSLGSAYWLVRQLLRPVEELRHGLSSLASGVFSYRIDRRSIRREDEISALADDFNVTANRLQELQDSQKRLFHDVSHELRSPLSRLQAATGVLRKNPARLDAMLSRMDTEIERLDLLVEEILTLARLSTSDRPLERQTIDILDLANDIVDDASFEAQARGVAVRLEGVETFIARVDGELIYRAIENVVRNAIKYTIDGSTVTLKAMTINSALHLCVSDRGPGVSQTELNLIFEPFLRLAEQTSVPGHGLGLAITKRAIELHGGSVRAAINAHGGLDITLVFRPI